MVLIGPIVLADLIGFGRSQGFGPCTYLPSKSPFIAMDPLSDWLVELPSSFRLFTLFSCDVFGLFRALHPSSRFSFFARLTPLSRFSLLMCLVGLKGCAHKSVLSIKVP